jgi:hypothetical protein
VRRSEEEEAKHQERVKADAELRQRLTERIADFKARGERYPVKTVGDFSNLPVIRLGRVPYDRNTLDRFERSGELRRMPVPLPDDFVLDGECRLPNETDLQYKAYCFYRDLGPKRAMRPLSIGEFDGKVRRWSFWYTTAHRMRWDERVSLWEATLEAETNAAIQERVSAVADEYAERRIKYLDRELNIVDLAFSRLEEMLKLPPVRKRTVTEEVKDKSGRVITQHITIWEAANWSYGDIAKLIGEVKNIGRLNHGLSTSNASMKMEQSVSGTIGVVQSGQTQDFGNMSPQERSDHEYARQKADDAYFAALAERQASRNGVVVDSVASVAAGD